MLNLSNALAERLASVRYLSIREALGSIVFSIKDIARALVYKCATFLQNVILYITPTRYARNMGNEGSRDISAKEEKKDSKIIELSEQERKEQRIKNLDWKEQMRVKHDSLSFAQYDKYTEKLLKELPLKVMSYQFEAEIHRFKKCFGIRKIDNIFYQHCYVAVSTQKGYFYSNVFWANPIFASYLSRNLRLKGSEPDISEAELKLYEIIGLQIPYRDLYQYEQRKPFGGDGGRYIEKHAINDYMDQFAKINPRSKVKIGSCLDIYEINEFFEKVHALRDNKNFILLPCWKDAHATVILGVIVNNEVQYAFLINSWVSEPYFNHLKERLQFPLFEASHSLQQTDLNCTLYSKNFTCAIYKLLNDDPEFAHELCTANLKEAERSLAKKLVEKMKPYLPAYYKNDGTENSQEAITHYHLQERWSLGSQKVKEYHLQAKKFVEEEVENRRCNDGYYARQ